MGALSFPNESQDYRAARNALLEAERDLRRRIEKVAEQRRALPLGGEVPDDYAFDDVSGKVRLSELFAGKDTLLVYNFMFAESPCPMCSGAALLYKIPRIVVGENVTFQGPEEYVRSQGVKVNILNDPTCIQLMRDSIEARLELWNEDIGM